MLPETAKIYIAGHNGLVGSAIERTLVSRGYTNIVTRASSELDLTDQQATAEFLRQERPDYVFLAAAKVGGIHANNTYPAEFMYQNLMIQSNVIHQSYLNGVKGLLFLGSSCIYPKLAPQPLKEKYLMTGPLEPTNSAYATAKIAGIEMCWSYNRQYGTRFIPVMPTNLYGMHDNFDLESSHVLPAMIRKFHLAMLAAAEDYKAIAEDEARYGQIPNVIKNSMGIVNHESRAKQTPQVLLWGTGRPLREFLYVDDLADACIFLMNRIESTLDSDLPMALFNIGSGSELTISDLASLIAGIVGFEGEIIFDPRMPDGTPRKLLDTTRMEAMGWRAATTLEEGIKKTYAQYTKGLRVK